MTVDTNQVQPALDQSKEDNLVKMRKHYEYQLAQERAAKEAAERQLQEAHKFRAPTSDDDDDEPYVDNKKLKKVLGNFAADMDKKIEEKAEIKARSLLEQEKQSQYVLSNPDFQQVMNSDIVQKFADTHPRLAEQILRMPEGFDRQKLVFEAIKSMGIDKAPAKQMTTQEKIDANRKSPYYQPSGVGASPYNSQSDFSQSGQQNAYQKMQELIRNRRS